VEDITKELNKIRSLLMEIINRTDHLCEILPDHEKMESTIKQFLVSEIPNISILDDVSTNVQQNFKHESDNKKRVSVSKLREIRTVYTM
jgi:hypothetical protein